MHTYVKDAITVTVEVCPGRVRVTLCDSTLDRPHVSYQYGNPPKLARSVGAELRADGYTKR